MIDDLINYFKGKKILILGFGIEGVSTYKLIRKYLKNQHLYISDQKLEFQNNYDFLKQDKNVTFIDGKKYLQDLNNFDIIMKSPGISFASIATTDFSYKIKSQLELLLEFFYVFTIGITGTKGKSTTSSLIYKILKDQNYKTMLLGNIGTPVFDYLDNITSDTYLVLEMSSHQLEYMKLSPNIAVILNVFPEHLDHYKSFSDYVNSKCNIFKYQKKDDFVLYNSDNEILNNFINNMNGNIYKVSFEGNENCKIFYKDNTVFFENKPIYKSSEPRKLIGDYNLNNLMFVLGVSKILNLDLSKTLKSISEFQPLKHRLEFVGTFNNILYYDNSIGTVPNATIEAVLALKDVDTLIIGGMDRGINYDEFINFLNKSLIRNIICMPKTGHDIAKKLNPKKTYIVNTLEEAVSIAKEVTLPHKICLLSPTAASYDFFKNFEEKGDLYQKLVKIRD